MKILAVIISALIASTVYAHHGSNGQFNLDIDLQITGVVTELKFVNPHSYVYLDVKNDDGEIDAWRCEMRAGGFLRRLGWREEMFRPGTTLNIQGAPARREEFGCYVASLTLEDGRVLDRHGNGVEPIEAIEAQELSNLRRADGTPNLSGNWGWINAGASPERAAAAGLPEREARSEYKLTEAGRAAVVGMDREDSPRFHCEQTNIFHDWTFNEHANLIEQSDDEIVMHYGFMGLVRTIHLNVESHAEDIAPSRAGHSIGRWEDDELVVDTIGFLPGVLSSIRTFVKHSDEMRTQERISMSDDGNLLQIDYQITDPLYLTEPYTARTIVVRTTHPLEEYECLELTEEVVPGF